MSNKHTFRERILLAAYRAALFAFPRSFRERYGPDAAELFLDLVRSDDETGRYRRATPRAAIHIAQAVVSGLRERAAPVASTSTVETQPKRGANGDTLRQDVSFAFRSFRKRPGFSLTAVALVALGIGATATVFSAVDTVLIRGLPYPEADRLIFFDEGSHTGPDYRDWIERLPAFETVAAARPSQHDLLNEGAPTRIAAVQVTANLLPLLGALPHRGRLFSPDDEIPGSRVALLSYDFWIQRWGGDASILGRALALDDEVYEVIGILAPGFVEPRAVIRRTADIWLPLDLTLDALQNRGHYSLGVVGRLADEATLNRAITEIDAWETWGAENHPDQFVSSSGEHRDVPLIPLHEASVRGVSGSLYMLLGAAGLMLLISCANVANLFLARGMDRERELAVRTALGASRGRVIRQLLTESVLLSAVGGFVGVLLATWGVSILSGLNPGNVPQLDSVTVDPRILVFTAALSVLTGVIFGLLPALYATRGNVHHSLKQSSGRSSANRTRLRLKNALVVAEIAVAMVLVVGAGLLLNSYMHLSAVDPGFAPERVVSMPLSFGPEYEGLEPRSQFTRQIIDRVSAIPGVVEATAGVTLPFNMGGRCCWMTWGRSAQGADQDSSRIVMHPVAPNYFSVLGARFIGGRDVRWSDQTEDGSVAVISRTMALKLFGTDNPIGETFTVGRANPTSLEVIGVIDDIRHWSLSTDDDVDVYVPYDLLGADIEILNVAVRTSGEVVGIGDAMRQSVWAIDGQMPVPEIRFLSDQVDNSIAGERFLSTLVMVFGTIAIVLAALGIYGTVLYSVSQRQHEFGIRLALGASSGRLLRFVIAQGVWLTGTGVVVGVVGTLALSRVLRGFLFGISPTDPATIAIMAAAMAIVTIIACVIPARRAAGTDPIGSLRSD